MRTISFRVFLLILGVFWGQFAVAQTYTLHACVTMAPVSTGPSGYVAALATGTALQFEVVDLNNGMVAFRGPATGRYARTGNAQYVGFNMGSGRLPAAHDVSDPNPLWRLQEIAARAPAVQVGYRTLYSARNAQGSWVSPDANSGASFEIRLTDWGTSIVTHACGQLFDVEYYASGNTLHYVNLPAQGQPCDEVSDALVDAVYDVQNVAFDDVGQMPFLDGSGTLLAILGRRY